MEGTIMVYLEELNAVLDALNAPSTWQEAIDTKKADILAIKQFTDDQWNNAKAGLDPAGGFSFEEAAGFFRAIGFTDNELANLQSTIQGYVDELNAFVQANAGPEVTIDDVTMYLELFGIDVSGVSTDTLNTALATMDFSTGQITLADIENFFQTAGFTIDGTMTDMLNLIVETVNTALSGGDVDYAPIFAMSVYDSLDVLIDLSATNITEQGITDYLNANMEGFNPANINKQGVLDFFTAMGVDYAALDKSALLAELQTLGINLVPTADKIVSVLKNMLNITVRQSQVQTWLDTNVDGLDVSREAFDQFVSDFNIDLSQVNTDLLNRTLLEFDITPVPKSEKILEYLAQLNITGISMADIEASLATIDLKELQYDREAIVAWLADFGVDAATLDPTTFEAVLTDLGVNKVPQADKIVQMLEHVGVTDVAIADILNIIEGIDLSTFTLTRESVFSFFEDLGIDYSTLSSIKINEIMQQLGIAEPAIDVGLVQEMLAHVGITNIEDAVIQGAIDAAGITANTVVDKPGVVEFLYGIGVDYEQLDPLAFQEVLTQLGVEPPMLDLAKVEELLKNLGVNVRNIDRTVAADLLSNFDFETEILDQKTVIEFLRAIGVEIQFLDPVKFEDMLFQLGIDTPRLSIDDVLKIVEDQGLDPSAVDQTTA